MTNYAGSDQQIGLFETFDLLREANHREYADLSQQIAESQLTIVKGIALLKRDLASQHLETPEDKRLGTEEEGQQQEVDGVAANIVRQAKAATDIGIALSLLRTLRFKTMKARYTKVPRAHEKTLQWMFSHEFSRWLALDRPLFWVSGKPGSGKSTLMKFLVDNDMTRVHLRNWSGGCQVAMSHYFFWVNGTELERSQEGLLRSLLYEILRGDPGLIKAAFPERWSELEEGIPEDEVSPWAIQELRREHPACSKPGCLRSSVSSSTAWMSSAVIMTIL